MDEALLELIAMLRELSPDVWQIMVHQVYAQAISNILWGLVSAAASAWSYKRSIKLFQASDDNPIYEVGAILLVGLTFFGALAAVACASQTALMFINPEFYAIQYLLSGIGIK